MRIIALQQIVGRFVASDLSISQAYLARKVRVNPSTVSRHLSGDTAMTLDQFAAYIREIGSTDLVFELIAALLANVAGDIPKMNNIDESFPAVVAKSAEEYEEGLEACRVLQKTLCNVTSPERFSSLPEVVQEQVKAKMAQAVSDVFYAMHQMISTADKTLGLRPPEYFGLTVRKLIERGYVNRPTAGVGT